MYHVSVLHEWPINPKHRELNANVFSVLYLQTRVSGWTRRHSAAQRTARPTRRPTATATASAERSFCSSSDGRCAFCFSAADPFSSSTRPTRPTSNGPHSYDELTMPLYTHLEYNLLELWTRVSIVNHIYEHRHVSPAGVGWSPAGCKICQNVQVPDLQNVQLFITSSISLRFM